MVTRVEPVSGVPGDDPQFPSVVFGYLPEICYFEWRLIETEEAFFPTEKAVFGTQPDGALVILQDITYILGMISQRIVDKGLLLSVKAIDALRGYHPKVASFILKYIVNGTTTEAGGIFWVITVDSHLITVIAIESIAGTKPHITFAVLDATLDRALGKSFLEGNTLEVDLLLLGLAEQTCCEKN